MVRRDVDPMAKMADAFRGHHQASKPPAGMKNPYARSQRSNLSQNTSDRNFVNENWDDEEDNIPSSKIPTSDKHSGKCYSTVQADANWLDDDFDS